MSKDCTQPSPATKPRFVCHASPKLPSHLTSVWKGSKPSIAPKPKVKVLLNGNHGDVTKSRIVTKDVNINEVHETCNGLNTVFINTALIEDQLNASCESPKSGLRSEPNKVDKVQRDGEQYEEEIQSMEEDWRLNCSVLKEEGASLKTLWASEDSLTAVSVGTDAMIDLEDMEAVGCCAGEALADTEGLSVGDISVNSAEEGAHFYSKQEKLEPAKDRSRADGLSESPVDELELCHTNKTMEADDKHDLLTRRDKKKPDPDWCCNNLKLQSGNKVKEKDENRKEICLYECITDKQNHIDDKVRRLDCLEGKQPLEPFYVSSVDIISTEVLERGVLSGKYEETEENARLKNKMAFGGRDEFDCDRSQSEDDKADEHEALSHMDCQPRLRQVALSVLTDKDTSVMSSSESQLLTPSDSDDFREEDDFEGLITPFLDETTDTENDINDDHVYEEPGETPCFDCKVSGIRSRSVSHRVTNTFGDRGVQFLHKTYVCGFGQPALSSSPRLSSTRQKTLSKPHYLSLYPRSFSLEGQETSLCVYNDGSFRQREAVCSSESLSRCSPMSSSALSTPTSLMDIPPPFELSYITKKPITKSSPSLLTREDSSEKKKKKKTLIKRFLMLKFGRKTEEKPVVIAKPSSLRSPADSSQASRLLDLDRKSISGSPQLNSRSMLKQPSSPEPTPTFLLYKDCKRNGNSVAFLNRSVIRVESFEDRSRVPFAPLPLTKPRSISFPNTDTSDYENVPRISSDYENVQVPHWRPIRQAPVRDFFDRPHRVLSSANETDGYVDMKSLPGFEKKTKLTEQETESAYTEAYKVCSVAVSPQIGLGSDSRAETGAGDEQGRTSDEEDGGTNHDRQIDGRSRAFYIVKELADTERAHVKTLKLLHKDFPDVVRSAVGDVGQPVLDDERLREILNELPDVYTLHRKILTELENRIRHWEESQRIADIFLSRKAEFLVFTTYIGHYDRSMSLLDDSCRTSPAFASIVQKFEEQRPAGERLSFKQLLLRVIVRVAQYRLLLTDYLNNLSPDSLEYKDTQAAVAIVSDISDQVNDSLKHGENLLRLINIAYSVSGLQDLLHPGRVFVKEGTLMKVSRKSCQPRHLFLMNDMLLYTYPQQDGKYRLKNTLTLTGLKVTKPSLQNVQNALKIEGRDISILLSADSFLERDDWFYTLNRVVTEHMRGSAGLSSCTAEGRDRVCLSLGEKAPTLLPVSQVMMCMNCTADFSLTLRRHHCHSCGRIVCRSCSRNRYPLKYMKDRMAKVCDHCFSELKKRGGDVSAQASPRLTHSSRPLSTVFQNIHPPNIWRHRKGTASFTQVTVSEEGSISGTLQRSKKSKRNWKRLWFLLKDKVLYTYREQEEKVASESLPLLGFTVKLPDRPTRDGESNIFQLYHQNTLYYTFKAEDNFTAQRWVNAMEEATNL